MGGVIYSIQNIYLDEIFVKSKQQQQKQCTEGCALHSFLDGEVSSCVWLGKDSSEDVVWEMEWHITQVNWKYLDQVRMSSSSGWALSPLKSINFASGEYSRERFQDRSLMSPSCHNACGDTT